MPPARAKLYRFPLGGRSLLTPFSLTTIELRRFLPGCASCEVFGSEFWDPPGEPFSTTLTDTVAYTDAVSGIAAMIEQLTDALDLLDALAVRKDANVALADALAMADTLGAALDDNVTLAELVTVADALAGVAVMAERLVEAPQSYTDTDSYPSTGHVDPVADTWPTPADSLRLHAAFLVVAAESVSWLARLSVRAVRIEAHTTRLIAAKTTRTRARMTAMIRVGTDSADTFDTVLTADGAPYPLDNIQAVWLEWESVETGAKGTLELTVRNAAAGTVYRDWTAADLEPGVYRVRARMRNANAKVLSFPNDGWNRLEVLPSN